MAFPISLAALVPDLIKGAVNLFDKKFQTEAEKEQAIRDYTETASARLQGAWDEEQKQLTERHKNDMASDSFLSKNIRPMALLYLMALFTMAFFLEVPQAVLEMLRDLLMTVFVFYFGSRTLEKITNQLRK
jgi:cation transport ATPase